MPRLGFRLLGAVTAAVTLISMLGVTVSGVASGQPANILVGPKEHFTAQVNGHSKRAVVAVVCSMPLQTGETGYPLAGQSVGLELGGAGRTGSLATSIVTTFTPTATVTFTQYETQSLPSTLVLPCAGSGTVTFAPEPTSSTARSASVTVTYASVISVTQADSGNSYTLNKGEGLAVELSGSSDFTWTEPTSSKQAVLRRTSGSSGATATATFIAIGVGKAQVTAFGTVNCSPPCPGPIELFQVNITVAR